MKPLEGVKIVEFSTVVTAALATTMLSEQGAHTVKVEPVGIGDTLRYLGTSKAGVSAVFANCNRGKQTIAVNLKSPEGLEIAKKLTAEADVLISNYRPGVLDRIGLGSEPLRELNPRLIYAAISGFGNEGPLAKSPAYDHVIQSLTGFTALQGDGDNKQFMKTFVCDAVTAYTICQAITAALFQRCTTGLGQHIDISMMESALYFLWPAGMMDHTLLDDDVDRKPHYKTTYRTYPTADGFIGMAPFTDTHWHGMFKALGHQEMLTDPKYATMAGRATNMTELLDIFQNAFFEMSTTAALDLLAKLDVPSASCLSLDEVIEQPQIKAIGAIQTQHHPIFGSLRSPAHPARFGSHQFDPQPPAGVLGEHTRDVLDELGYSTEQIDSLAERGIVGVAENP
jgi:crotonobetainyl-CoA:carnitine CoA-transferase CaiB-like acyl-CoA transferase